ncbi:MAG: hypothetical protein ACOCZ5_00085 [bacterium]
MLVVNVAGYNFSFSDKRTGKTIVVPCDGKSHKIPDYSPLNFRELKYLNVLPMKKEKSLNVNVNLNDIFNNDNVSDLKEEYKEEIKMIEEEKITNNINNKKIVKKGNNKSSIEKKKPLSGRKISTKKRKELLEKYRNKE